ncbi:MAG TPA: glycerate kinase [Candidatus Acidoferrales bacterium]|nr:glycerate kinase [Candidatus Acidoferrales bacterium]
MRICIAPDKFKGSLTAAQAAQAIARGIARWLPDAKLEQIPVADGGDGTAQALVDALGGRMVSAKATGPNGRQVSASYGMLDAHTAIIELAQASGLALVPAGTNDPLTATTRGTGELIVAAIESGARRIILAIGGSATNDAGTGALRAMGARFLDAKGQPLPEGGAALRDLASIDLTSLARRLEGIRIEIASDVRNPLCGPMGASAVYGPQKGASPEDVRVLDEALRHFADVVKATVGVDIRDVPGAGAAGGAGGGFLGLAQATLRPGAELVLEVLDFARRIAGASIVITGEGRLDRQTLAGKAPYAVAQAAHKQGIPVVALAGSVDCAPHELHTAGIDAALSIVAGPMEVEEAMRRAPELLMSAAETLARLLSLHPA